MTRFLSFRLIAALSVLFMLTACVAHAPRQADYTAFRNSKPRTIVVLPPINDTADVNAPYGMLSQMTMPLAEGGYYVVPVVEMEETFRHNGLTTPNDIQSVAPDKLRQIFGADAAVYTKITQYGSKYMVVDSTTVVSASAKLVDLRSGDTLWQGSASATGKELGANFGANTGLIGALVQAAVKQVAHTLTDEAHDVAGLTSNKLLSSGGPNGLLYGPRSPKYGTD
ncbi:DUF799 domain-containing protein [Paraburkholderia sp. LEh10]|uniref:DUF799 domain-containing protein n=1 Tax=Paraburkholderia sp. LEh10 TaxID=2821353 RepID=UPI001AE35E8D|nr:DUF799 domain-containing protein [Paraburkholderia sp. LEh10]MBP0591353.1 DUF799 domain-containing protein [Paraburkholderia sp. LEh10]